jgi:hypothetical protein
MKANLLLKQGQQFRFKHGILWREERRKENNTAMEEAITA